MRRRDLRGRASHSLQIIIPVAYPDDGMLLISVDMRVNNKGERPA